MAEIISLFNSFHCFRHISLSPLRREDVSWLEFCEHLARRGAEQGLKTCGCLFSDALPSRFGKYNCPLFGEKESPTPAQ